MKLPLREKYKARVNPEDIDIFQEKKKLFIFESVAARETANKLFKMNPVF